MKSKVWKTIVSVVVLICLIPIAVFLWSRSEVVEEKKLQIAARNKDIEALKDLLLNAHSFKIRLFASDDLGSLLVEEDDEDKKEEIIDIFIEGLFCPNPGGSYDIVPFIRQKLASIPHKKSLFALMLLLQIDDPMVIHGSLDYCAFLIQPEMLAREPNLRLNLTREQEEDLREEYLKWWRENEDYVYYDEEKKKFEVDVEAKKASTPINWRTRKPLSKEEVISERCYQQEVMRKFYTFRRWYEEDITRCRR